MNEALRAEIERHEAMLEEAKEAGDYEKVRILKDICIHFTCTRNADKRAYRGAKLGKYFKTEIGFGLLIRFWKVFSCQLLHSASQVSTMLALKRWRYLSKTRVE